MMMMMMMLEAERWRELARTRKRLLKWLDY
jgi:hypothetical protein